MTPDREQYYLLIDPNAPYQYGVILGSASPTDELHGPFATRENAQKFVLSMLTEYTDYTSSKIVKIELPQA